MNKSIKASSLSVNASTAIATELSETGFVYLEGLPEDLDLLAFLGEFGEIVPQYNNRRIWDIKPVPGQFEAPTSVGKAGITMHTELYEKKGWPPTHVAMLCRQPAATGGIFYLLDGYRLLKEIDSELRSALENTPVVFSTEESVETVTEPQKAVKRILQRHPNGRLVIQYDGVFVRPTDDHDLNRFADLVDQWEARGAFQVRQTKNSLLLWDNFRFLHARSSFGDSRRWLQRVCLASDII